MSARHPVDLTLVLLGALLAVLLTSGLFMPSWLVNLLSVALAKALVVIGLLVMMRSGLVDFGQGLYFGLGGYVVGILGIYLGITDVFVLLAVSLVSGTLLGGLLGLLMSRYRAIFFAMLSLGFSMILYGVLVKTAALGSTDGFNVVSPTFLGWRPDASGERYGLYSLACTLTVGVAYLTQRYLRSSLGAIGTAIRDNEVRVEYLGASVRGVLHLQYVFTAVVSSLGGALHGLTVGHVDPHMAYWTTSGEFVFVTLLSGVGHATAPLFGGVLFELLRSYALQVSPYTWQLLLGTALLLIIVFLPRGLWSLLRTRTVG
jgi:ABC-type branched-subunit amino acid transport system permease subunit